MSQTLSGRSSWLVRYGAAVAAALVGLLVRLALTAWFGPGLPTYITFYPAVMVVALLGGLGPGLVATAVAGFATAYWLLPPAGFRIYLAIDVVGLAFFSGMGLFMSLVAEFYRRARRKAAAYDRELAVRETRRQNELLASILERASQPFAVGYPDGRVGLVNRAFEELTGYTAQELRGLNWANTLTTPEWREIERQKLEELHRTGQPVRYEKEYLRKHGRRVPIELLVHLARDAEGKPEYYYSFFTDITERKQAEEAVRRLNAELQQRVTELQTFNEALHASRRAALNLMEDAVQARKQAEQASAELRNVSEQRRLALEAADLGAWDYHFQAGEVFWDERCREMWGVPRADTITYAGAIAAIHPEDRAGVDEAVQQALAGKSGGAYHREFRVVWPDGSVHWIASHGRVYFQSEGDERHAIRFIGANREITAEKAALEALRESRGRLAAFAAATFEGIVLSQQGRVVDCNEQFARMFGATLEAIKGRPIEQFLAPEDRERVLAHIRAGEDSSIEHMMLRADGSWIIVEAHGRPAQASVGGLRHTAIRDITARKLAETALKQTETALRESERRLREWNLELERRVAERTASLAETIGDLEDFSHSITHDLRAPLRAIRSFAQILGEECLACGRPSAPEHIHRITSAAARMDGLIQDVLQYSRLARSELDLEPVDVQALLDGIIHSYPGFQPPQVEIRIEGPLPRVLGNPAALTQCFSNLLGNAVKFVVPGTRPEVRIWAEPANAEGRRQKADTSVTLHTPLAPRPSGLDPQASPLPFVRLWFADNGVGIPKEAQERIFKMFQRLDKSYEGTGIGLTVVRKAVEKIGGRVGLESDEGKGSRFWLELLAAPAPAAAPAR